MMYLLFFSFVSASEDDYFNILSIDGGGIRGLIPAISIKHMEDFALEYS